MLFTPREQDILHLVADLRTRDEIQAIIGHHRSTLEAYLTRLYEKSDCHSYLALARYALDQGYGCRYQTLLTACPVEAVIAKRKAEKTDKPRMIIERAYKMKNKLIIEGRLI
jgi:DNA-binding CsgD family transcriptional regulator